MELNLHTSKPSKNSQAYPNDATSDTDTELSFEQVSRFWRSMSTERKEETLMIKEPKIIENVLQALNDVNFLIQCQGKRCSVETGRRTVLYPRPNKPAIILSIAEFDHSQSQEENTNEKSYHTSVVVLMLLGYENTHQPQQTYPNIEEEEELREYIYNIDLLEQHKALLKVKHAKLDGILGVFGELDSKFCQRKKKIIPEEQHWRLFQSHNRDQLSWGKALRAQSKISRYLKSVLKIFENDLIAAYEENKHFNGDLDDQNNDVLEQQSMPQLEQNDFDQEQPYYHDYHRRSSRYPDLYQYDISNTFQFYPSHHSNYMGYMVPQQFSQNYYSRNYYGKQKLRLVPVAHGVYFGNLAFSLKDHHIEEQEYGTEEELPPRRIKPNPFIHKNKREYATDYKPKRYYQTYNIKGQYNNDNKPNNQNSNQSDNLITPLQILLATPLQDQRLQNEYHAQENRTSDSKCSIPLLESIIQIPGSKILHTKKQPDTQESQVLSFDEQKGLLVVKTDENKSKTNENSSKSSPNKPLEDDTIKFFEEQLSSAKQDELELSTTTSMESTSKNGDKETQGEFYQKPRLKPSEGSNKKKLKNSNGNKSRGNARNKEWDRNLNGAKNPDNQSKRQTEFSHNLKDYSFDAFPTLEGTNNPRSKDKI